MIFFYQKNFFGVIISQSYVCSYLVMCDSNIYSFKYNVALRDLVSRSMWQLLKLNYKYIIQTVKKLL